MKTKNYFRVKNSTKKLLTATLLVFLALLSARAQSLKGGIVVGITSGDVKIDRSFNNVMSGKDIIGIEGGFFLKPKFGPFFVKPELLYEFKTGDVETQAEQTDNFENPIVSTKFTMHTLQVPVLLGLHLLGPLYLEGGPTYNYILSVTDNYNDQMVNLNKNGFGYRLGGGLDFGGLILHAHYQGISYNASSDNTLFKEPQKLIFGLSTTLGVREKRTNPSK